MMPSENELLEMAHELSEREDIPEWRGLMKVLMRYLEEIAWPEAVRPMFDAARSFWSSSAQPAELVEAKERCWVYLDSSEQAIGGLDRQVRALLCVLDLDGDKQKRSDTVEWFTAMLSSDS